MQQLSGRYHELQLALERRYEIRRELGTGGAATVFLAQDLRHDRPVALKVLRADCQTEEHEARFAREIRFLARLQHPNILPLHDSGQIHDLFYYVVPFVEGSSLRDRLSRERRLPVDEAVRITRALAEALDYAHRQGIIHRDIKPDNVLLSGAHPILADFGVARALETNGMQRLTQTGMSSPGTPAYMSPEQILGEEIDARTDIYGLGCMLYEMLAGVVPFPAREGLLRRVTEAPPPLSTVRSDVPVEIERAMLRALASEPRHRFADAGEFAAALAMTAHAPAAARVSAPARRLAAPSVALIGRDAEAAELSALLDRHRLVTIVGPGGVGKSRLAVHVANARHYHYPNGSALISVLPGRSADDLVAVIGEAMGVTFAGARSTKIQLFEALADKQVLIILDSFEHLIDAAPLVGELLQHAQKVSVVVTSRERLNIADEMTIEIAGLSTALDAGTRLFIDRAKHADPHFVIPEDLTEIGRIVSAVGGLPLGIEIAASLVRVLSCQEIADELERDPGSVTSTRRDIPERHRSLRGVFEQSWSLLDESQQSALMRLAVLQGSFSRDAAQVIGAASVSLLATLIDKSLLHRTAEGRFALHDVVRRFAEGKLRERSDVAAGAADARMEFFAQRLMNLDGDLHGKRVYDAVEAIATDLDGIRAGWRRAIERGRDDLLEAYLRCLFRFYLIRGRYAEGEREFAHAEDGVKSERLASVILARRATLAQQAGASSLAYPLLRRGVQMLRQNHRDSVEMGIVLRHLAFVVSEQGRQRAGLRLYERALALLRDRAAPDEYALALLSGSITYIGNGRYREAEKALEEAAVIFERSGEPRNRMMALLNLSIVMNDTGRPAEALRLRTETLTIARSTGDLYLIGAVLINLAESAITLGDHERARTLLAEAHNYHESVGRPHGVCMCEYFGAQIDLREERHDSALRRLRFVVSRALELDAMPMVMIAVLELARLRRATGREMEAKELAALVLGHPAVPAFERGQTEALYAALGGSAVDQAPERSPEEIVLQIKRLLEA